MGSCYHQNYTNFKRYRQERDGSSVHDKIARTIKKWHSQSANCSTFYTGIGKCKTKWSSENTNRLATYIEVEHVLFHVFLSPKKNALQLLLFVTSLLARQYMLTLVSLPHKQQVGEIACLKEPFHDSFLFSGNMIPSFPLLLWRFH